MTTLAYYNELDCCIDAISSFLFWLDQGGNAADNRRHQDQQLQSRPAYKPRKRPAPTTLSKQVFSSWKQPQK